MQTRGKLHVSVLLPVYNGERYLAAAIDSVLAQSFGDFELLLLDDGSTDGSLRIAREYQQRDARVCVHTRENRGLVATLNEGLTLARGEFIARMDADDVCLPQRLQRQLDYLRSHPEIVCVGGDHELIDEAGRLLTTVATLRHDAEIQREALRGHGTICHPSAMMRRTALRRVGGYRAQFHPAEDLDLWLRLGEIGRLANLRGAVLRYRLHAQSISGAAARQGRQRLAGLRACQAAWQRRGIVQGSYDAAEPWRPTGDRDSWHRHALRYGWWAWHSGERRTAAYYAWQAVRARPRSREGWALLVAALAKPTPHAHETPGAA